ncbi:MAG TPA: hypothetical protein VF701_09655 [Thermoanaerobaculia bacterium]
MLKIEASKLVEEATRELGISLVDLIALASVWVSPEVCQLLEPVQGVWYPQRRRANLGLRVNGNPVEAVGQVMDGITLDNNTYANVAFKRALGVDRNDFVGFHICHIWPGTAYDAACYTNIANLVAIPAELSSLTDHHPHIVASLKYRAWELYRWKPAKEMVPVKPEGYPVKWREPWPVNDGARRAVHRRVRGGSRDESEAATPVLESQGRLPVRTEAIPQRDQTQYLSGDAATDAAIVTAFYLSKFDHERLALGNQGDTFVRCARALGVNANSLRHYRDYFDSHTGSRREGWKKPLPPQLANPFPSLMRLDEETLRKRVLQLLARA